MSMRHVRVAAAAGAVAIGAAVGGAAAVAAKPSASTGRATTVSLRDYSFKPKSLTAGAGRLRVTAANGGKHEHEFVLIRTKRAAGALPTKGGRASEQGAVGEIPEQQPGERASHTFKLKPGKYVFICNVPGHYRAGMYGTLTVK
jgi:uncharacterized cupredoxin-like copper-binding protein